MNDITANHISASKAILDLTYSTADLRIPQILANHLPENSMKPIYKQLIINLLDELGDRFGNDGCNDTDEQDHLVKGINFKELENDYKVTFAKKIASEEYPPRLYNNIFLIELARKALKDLPDT